jgi:erythromycin esterase
MLDWMRSYNARAATADQLTLYGIDPRSGERDRIMAENVSELVAAQGPIVLWAHNGHIWAKEGSMGSYLKRMFGSDAYLLGFEFSRGRFTSRTGQIHTFAVEAAPPTFYAHALAQLDSSVLFLDMATMQQNPVLAEWLNTPQLTHDLAEGYHLARLLPGTRTAYAALPDLYDGLIFVEESTPASVLPGVD